MIKFDPALLTVDIVSLKTVTTSLGGSISVLDEKRSTAAKEVQRRIVVPMAVARSFIMKTKKVTRYLKPVLCALVKYNDTIVAMERHPLGTMGTLEYEGFDGKPRRWIPECEKNMNELIKPLAARKDRTWYFDGRYMFSLLSEDTDVAVRDGEFMTSDGRFRKVVASSVDLQSLDTTDKLSPADRSCLAFVTASGDYAISPPIWKNLSDVGGTSLKKRAVAEADDEDDGADDGDDTPEDVPEHARIRNFDKIDEGLSVNLNFALKAGNEIGRTFGYEHVEPLQLPRLMIELHTVNLPNVPPQVKATYDVGIKFTHALAWLLGMSRNANTLETYVMMRSLMKYLTKKGIFRNSTFDAAHVFRADKSVADVPKMELSQLLADNTTQMSLSAILDQARMGIKARKRQNEVHQFGGLLNEE